MKWSLFMKKIMKKLIPFLLVILILASLVWYCFVFDRNFARDVLLSNARYFSTNGNQKIAAWFYDTAYLHSGQDEGVAIELANQFKAEGNYTKAEYTLSQAIADSGSTDLYVALCKTFVEQNKLLDAVNMLEYVQNPTIRDQLNQMRPAAPIASPDPGLYTEYISVTLTARTGTIYYSTDGTYPSTDSIPYSEPITLEGGETTILAITVDDSGLVSPLAKIDFTIGGVIEPVTFKDPAIEKEVRELLEVDDEHVLYSNELWTITALTIPEGVTAFNDLLMLPYLESLTIEGYRIVTLAFLKSLPHLEELTLIDCRFSPDELPLIAALPELRKLTLTDCGLSTVLGLEGAMMLQTLDLSENALRNLEPLTSLVTLRSLNLSHNAITSLASLSALPNLELLDLSYNSVQGLTSLSNCTKLTWLDVSHNKLGSLGGVEKLTNLTHLAANYNQLSDISVLESCTKLAELELARNSLSDVKGLGKLMALEILDISYNQITDLPVWGDGAALRTIDGSHNQIKSVKALSNLGELSHVYLDYNAIEDVSPLATCYKLVMVNVYGNTVTGVEELTERSIIVNYNPT